MREGLSTLCLETFARSMVKGLHACELLTMTKMAL